MDIVKNKKIIILLCCGIFIVALSIRIIAVFYPTNIIPPDCDGYDQLGMSVLKGEGYAMDGKLTSGHEPLYSFFLALIYYFFGHSYTTLRIIQGILGAITCVLIFLISRRVFNSQIAVISALIACFNPSFIRISEHLRSENIFTFLLIVAIFFLTRQIQKHDFKNLIFLGLSLGLAALTRSMIFFFPLFLLLILGRNLFPQCANVKKYVLSIAIFIICFLQPILPWTLRNWRVHHSFVPIMTKTGICLYSSYVPMGGKLYGNTTKDEVTRKAELLSSEVERSNFLIKETIKYIKHNPLRVLKLELLKIGFFWCFFDWEIIGYGVYNFMFGFILPFFIFGIVVTFRRFKELLPIYSPIIYAFFIALVTYGSPRYRLPFEPYIIIIASAGIFYFVLRFSKKIYGCLLIGLYLLLNLFMYFNSYQVKLFAKSFLEKINLW